jgi:hypothetical protein
VIEATILLVENDESTSFGRYRFQALPHAGDTIGIDGPDGETLWLVALNITHMPYPAQAEDDVAVISIACKRDS